MALQKSKTLPSGESGDYWRVSDLSFHRSGMRLELVLSLYKSAALAAAGASPLPHSYRFSFVVTNQEIMGNVISMAYTKIKAAAAELVPPVSGFGDPASRYPDIVDAVDA